MSSLAMLSNLDTLNTLALLAVVFIGLPHGAMDGGDWLVALLALGCGLQLLDGHRAASPRG